VVTVVVPPGVVIFVSCLVDADFEHPIKPSDMTITMAVIKRFISNLFKNRRHDCAASKEAGFEPQPLPKLIRL
jgi:hypothetical protein